MSLQYWLPLINNATNQGLTGDVTTVMGSGITYTAGKLGTAATFPNNPNSCLRLPKLNLQTGSWCCWFKVLGAGADANYQYILSDGRDNNGGGTNIRLNGAGTSIYTDSHKVGINQSISLNTWYHITITFGDNLFSLYLNGELIRSVSYSENTDYTYSDGFVIGKMSRGYTATGSYFPFNGQINDVRVYDHRLSNKEIAEISKGLVLHYKLDSIDNNSTTNLVTSITAGGQTTVSNGVITTSGLDKDTYFTLNLSENIVNGTNYILSCDAEIPEGYYWRFPLGNQNNSTIPYIIYNGHNTLAFTANDIDWGTKRLFFDDNVATVRSSGIATKMWNFKLTKTGIIQDCSGYSNNATITGTTNLVTSSARYNYSVSMNNVNTSNHIESISDLILPTDAITATCWVKAAKATNHVIFVFPQLEFGTLNSLGYVNLSSAPGFTLTNFKDNDWNFITVIRQGTTYKLYINGIAETQNGANNYYLHNGNKLYLLNRNYNNGYAGNAIISDFRIYATALTENQIKELYNTSATIDNQGNIYARELVEI